VITSSGTRDRVQKVPAGLIEQHLGVRAGRDRGCHLWQMQASWDPCLRVFV
jgi:hypothetical protein